MKRGGTGDAGSSVREPIDSVAFSPDQMKTPDIGLQRRFWDRWNSEHRTGELDGDAYRQRQQRVAREVAQRVARRSQRPLRICDFGCGTGWLAATLCPFGKVTAIDLAPAACAWGRIAYPEVSFVEGDVLETKLDGPFDLVVSADVISHVPDQQLFVDRVAEMLSSGGVFLLMTQNGRIWSRTSQLARLEVGQIRDWPTPERIEQMFADRFSIDQMFTIYPRGDRGILRLINSRWLSGPLRRLGLGELWARARERAGIGCEIVIHATKTVTTSS